MTSVQIPQNMHKQMVERLRKQYEQEFGSVDTVVSYSREELISKYARDIHFWSCRVPAIHNNSQLRVACAHAICTNALAQMRTLARSKGILDEVETEVKRIAAEKYGNKEEEERRIEEVIT